MNIKTIEERIIDKAMADLKEEVDGYIRPFVNHISSNYHKKFSCEVEFQGKKDVVELKHQGFVIQILKKLLLQELTEERKKQALDSFMTKVDRLSRAYEELGLYQEENQQ